MEVIHFMLPGTGWRENTFIKCLSCPMLGTMNSDMPGFKLHLLANSCSTFSSRGAAASTTQTSSSAIHSLSCRSILTCKWQRSCSFPCALKTALWGVWATWVCCGMLLQFLMYSSKGKGLELYIRTTKKDNQGQAKAGSLICHIYDLEVKNVAYVTISEANQSRSPAPRNTEGQTDRQEITRNLFHPLQIFKQKQQVSVSKCSPTVPSFQMTSGWVALLVTRF